MEVFTKLEEAIKEAGKAMRDIRAKFDEYSNQISALNAKYALIATDVKALEEKRDTLDEKIKEERRQQLQEIDERLKQVNALKEDVSNEKSKLQAAIGQASYQEAEYRKKAKECEDEKQKFIEAQGLLDEKLQKFEQARAMLVP